MFLPYFNFKENPFKLTIDLAYLYLGSHHDEARAHLTYAVSEGEGFIVITGERGVGKTTVCRSFLEGLNKNVETAYIDRSTSNPQKLLLYINAEFKIRSKTASIKDLADALNEFLMRKRLEGKKVAVFIDDAHRLNSDVLEQVRLISNLETTKDKLLQLVLIGQPKLSEMLNSNELRQIGQRVSVGYCIGPLTYDETLGYIQHRLTIASKGPPIRFDPKAVRRIFNYSRGIPRSINIVCHRALEIAYQRKLNYIDSDIAKATIRYLSDRAEIEKPKFRNRWLLGSFAAICCLVSAIAIAAYFFRTDNESISSKRLIAVKKVPIAKGAETEMPDDSVVSAPVTPMAPAIKEELPLEPFQPDRPAVPAETSSKYGANQRSTSMMTRSVPAEIPAPSSERFGEEQDSTPMMSDSSPGEGTEPSLDGAELERNSMPMMTHSVQVGAFRRMENAANLIGRLEIKGYSAYVLEISDAKDRLWFTVRIGDHPTLESAEEQAGSFMAQENMKAFVRPYNAF